MPVLKEAGVVDAGAQGVLEIIVGAKKAFAELSKGNGGFKVKSGGSSRKTSAGIGSEPEEICAEDIKKLDTSNKYRELKEVNIKSNIKYMYCTQVIVKGSRIDIKRLRGDIESLGDSTMVVGNEQMANIHVHTNTPNKVLRRALREGTLHDVEINNMVDQTIEAGIIKESEEEGKKKEEKKAALAVVSNGDGLEEIFKSIGADVVIKGGQSMNPSTYDIVKAITKLGDRKTIIFPNNKNIVLTAEQAKKIIKEEVIVVPTKTIPQGITAVLNYNHDLELEENIYNMKTAVEKIKTGEITVAVRNANLLVGEIKKGDFIGLCDGKVRVISDNIVSTAIDLVRDVITSGGEVITFYTGKDARLEDNDKIKRDLEKYFPKIEVEFYEGDQPLYPYIFSVE